MLRIERSGDARIDVDLGRCAWIGFLRVGEAFYFVHEGWWLLETPDGGVAVNVDCWRIDALLRDGDLAAVAARIAHKFATDMSSRPRELCGRNMVEGVAVLTVDQFSALRTKGVMIGVDHIAEFPIVT